MATFTNSMPEHRLNGIKDETTRRQVVERQSVPQHCPLFYILAKKGPLTTMLHGGNSLITTFGAETLNERGPFFTHGTLGLTIANAQGNSCFVKRVVPDDATIPSLVFSLEVVATTLPAYQRNADGSVARDANGVKLLDAVATVAGHQLRWSVGPLSSTANLRGENAVAGTMVGSAGETSTVYPIFAIRDVVGANGNNTGLRLSYPGPATSSPGDLTPMEDQGAQVYRAQWMVRDNAVATPRVLSSIAAEPAVDFCLKDGAINTRTDADMGMDRITDAYAVDLKDGTPPTYGPVEEMYYYQNNLETVLNLLHAKEVTSDANITEAHLVNVFNALDINGNDHYTVRMDGGVKLNGTTTHYMTGGSDGTLNNATYDALVNTQVTTGWEDVNDPLVNEAKFPFSVIYGTGFSLATSKSILLLMGKRKDIHVAVSTQDSASPANSSSDETSLLTSLRATARLVPESTVHGTATCRAVIVGRSGKVKGSNYKGTASAIFDLIEKRAMAMGAGDGVWKEDMMYDVSPANRIVNMTDLTLPWSPRAVRSKDWELGLCYPESANMTESFWPAIQTVYDKDSSTLGDDKIMMICVDLEKKSMEVHREMEGNGSMEDGEFLAACNALMAAKTDGIYAGRCKIVPNAYYTKGDEARGFSYTMDIVMYGKGRRTVGTFNIIARRYSDL